MLAAVALVHVVAEIFGRPDLEIKRVSLDNITVDVSSTFSTSFSVVSRSSLSREVSSCRADAEIAGLVQKWWVCKQVQRQRLMSVIGPYPARVRAPILGD